MRLLKRNNTGEFGLTDDFVGDDIPRYAILSHTWGVAAEEVSFKDMMHMGGTGKSKPGYDKIRFCGEQARHDGLQYFWIDTCCIDKDPEWIRKLTKDELIFNGAVRVLCDYGLVEVDMSSQERVESRGYSIHGCVYS